MSTGYTWPSRSDLHLVTLLVHVITFVDIFLYLHWAVIRKEVSHITAVITCRQICADVWSPISIEAAAIEHVLPFIRICALLQFHLFSDVLPSLSTRVWSMFVAVCCLPIELMCNHLVIPIYTVSQKKFPPLNSLWLCQILTDFQIFALLESIWNLLQNLVTLPTSP